MYVEIMEKGVEECEATEHESETNDDIIYTSYS